MPLSFSYWKHRYSESSDVLLLSVFLYILSLFFPAFYTGNVAYNGWEALLLGWSAILGGCVSWLANPCYFSVLWLSKSASRSSKWAIVGLVLALSFLYVDSVFMWEYEKIQRYGWGYYLWLASLSLLAVRQVGVMYHELREREEEPIKYILNLLITRYRFGICVVLILIAAEVFVYFHNPSIFF